MLRINFFGIDAKPSVSWRLVPSLFTPGWALVNPQGPVHIVHQRLICHELSTTEEESSSRNDWKAYLGKWWLKQDSIRRRWNSQPTLRFSFLTKTKTLKLAQPFAESCTSCLRKIHKMKNFGRLYGNILMTRNSKLRIMR